MKKVKVLPKGGNDNAQFSDSQVGLDQGKHYLVYLVDSSLNEMAVGSDNRNIIVAAVPTATVIAGDDPVWIRATVGSRAFKDCGVVSAEQKSQALKNQTPFELWWTPGEERPAREGREAYIPKIWKSKTVHWDEEEEG